MLWRYKEELEISKLVIYLFPRKNKKDDKENYHDTFKSFDVVSIRISHPTCKFAFDMKKIEKI